MYPTKVSIANNKGLESIILISIPGNNIKTWLILLLLTIRYMLPIYLYWEEVLSI